MKTKLLSMFALLLMAATGTMAQTETLLTTITATAKEQASDGTANVATVSFSYTAGGSSAYLANWGWWGYGWSATVNAPYLFMPSATGDVDFSGTYTLPATIAADNTPSGDWKFYGTYSTLTYGTAPFSGHVYGFAAQAEGDVKAGQFVKATTGATVPPMRCYLTYKDGAQYSEARSFDGAVGSDPMPQTITVRLIDINGQVTSIGTLDTCTSEFTTDGWYTLDGHRLLGKPSKKGLYINNGKKVIIK